MSTGSAALSIDLQDVEINMSAREPSTEQGLELHEITTSCHEVLTDVERILDQYCELEASSSADGQERKKKTKRGWKRLRWEPQVIRDLRSRIDSNKSLGCVQYPCDQMWLSVERYAAQHSDYNS
ncbi:hypothetical protein BDV29DRAFT_125531 [Aspergillus leporis]|jgi:hypothetical protein|uniref:Uncharacterized protein n=1 Tax=Aspergillus leporis TaxID=41062 RepID=A0A5N5X436_9EURO|nr:hypothetical protein BDV29DRAFT_125531 [Aspergillus leporis]